MYMRLGLKGALFIVALLALASAATAATPQLVCNTSENAAAIKTRPASCLVMPFNASSAESVNLAQITWTSWGNQSAVGRGVELGMKIIKEHIPVKIIASNPKKDRCGGNIMLYTRLQATSKFGTTVSHPGSCYGND